MSSIVEWRTGEGPKTPESLEQVRQILLSSPEHSNSQVAADLGCSREWVRRVRRGEEASGLFPELPRLLPLNQRNCTCCVHWVSGSYRSEGMRRQGACSLGHSEPDVVGTRYGLGCGAFISASGEEGQP